MPWRPSSPGERPTLGWYVLDWMSEYLAAPDRGEYEPYVPTREQAAFVLDFYELDPHTGRRRYRRGVISRSKGWGKSPFLAALAAAEALADVVPDGWDADGQPAGKPWTEVRTPWVQLAAASEDQTKNSWTPLLEMLREGPVLDEYGLEPLGTFVNLPRGRIEFVTAAATSREGNRPTFCVLDQTESWFPTNGGTELAAAMRRNLGKTGGSSIESPNAYLPGMGSVAEDSAEYWRAIVAAEETGHGAKDAGLLYDHREAPADVDMHDRESLLAGLAVAYGDSASGAGGWVDLERIVAEVWDPDTDPSDARRYYLNSVVAASDSWIAPHEWDSCESEDRLADDDAVTLGFDGSIRHDSTALVACRVSDGLTQLLAIEEEPDGPEADEWQVDREAIDAAIFHAFERFRVVGMYADPAHWWDSLDRWNSEFGRRVRVRATQARPFEWPMNRPSMVVPALARFRDAVRSGQVRHDGGQTLRRHVLNARRRETRSGTQIFKEHPSSPRKIDAAIAATLAYEARQDAVAQGAGRRRTTPTRRFVGA